jgi:hypothetical protein
MRPADLSGWQIRWFKNAQAAGVAPLPFSKLHSVRGGKGLDQRGRDELDRSTRSAAAVRTRRNKALQPTGFGDLGRPADGVARRGRGSVHDTVCNPRANRNHRNANPERTVAAAQRPPPLPAGDRQKARLAGVQLVHRCTEKPPLVPE